MNEKTRAFLPVVMIAVAIASAVMCAMAIEQSLSSYQTGFMKVYTGKSTFHMLALSGNGFQFGLRHSLPILFYGSGSLLFLGLALSSRGKQAPSPSQSKSTNIAIVLGILLLHVAGLLLLLELILY